MIAPAPAGPSATARAWRLLVGPAIRKMEHPAVTNSASAYSVALYLPHRQAVRLYGNLGAVHHTFQVQAASLCMRAEPGRRPQTHMPDLAAFACAELHAHEAAAHIVFTELWWRQQHPGQGLWKCHAFKIGLPVCVHQEVSRETKVSPDAAPYMVSCKPSALLTAIQMSCAEGPRLHLLCIMTVPQAITGKIFAHFPSVCTGNDTYLHVTRTTRSVA